MPNPAQLATAPVVGTAMLSKEQLAAQRAALRARYLESNSPRDLLRRHTALIDDYLKLMWRHLNMPPAIALVAVGGYGRGELYPCSDVDLLVLLESPADGELSGLLEQFISTLWDTGLRVGPSVRTVEECLALAATDVTVQTNLLEARLLTGNDELYLRFEREFRSQIDAREFCSAKRLEQEQRHERYHDTNLEPNIKESAGGLRDLHTILWISRAAGIGASWAQLVAAGIITGREAARLKRHEVFLQNLRIRLHYLAERHEERLLFDVQTALAEQLGIRTTTDRRASEHLMQRYYRTAKEVSQINTVMLQSLVTLISPPRMHEPVPINERFLNRNELLEARDENLFVREPGAMFEAIRLLQEHHELKDMTAQTLRALWRATGGINREFRADPRNRAQFMQILAAPTHVQRSFVRMNQYGMLGRYIPAFGRVVGQMQHDLYHVYTVDEHILTVLNNLRRFAVPELAHEFPMCSRLMSDFARPELIYLGALFHDIAKGRGGDHSTLGKRDAASFCRAHGLARDEQELVVWLVANHLTMSMTAQKEDLADPDVIDAFAAKVRDERHLVALYLLTVADIRGTSPKVWNAWKGKLLEDLFLATQRRLGGDARTLDSSLQQRQDQARAKLRLYAIGEQAHEKLWAELDFSYFLRHSADEIAWHTRLLNYRVDTKTPVVKARLSTAGEGLQIMVYVRDQKDLFARICSFFERGSYTIMAAKIYTTRHGYALDSFEVNDMNSDRPHYRDMIAYVEYELGQRLLLETPLEPLTQGRLSRRLKHFPVTPEIVIQPDARGNHVLQIVAGDRPGLLSRVARCLIKYNINLHTARINTLGDRAEDVLLIQGDALKEPKTTLRFEADLLEQLQT